MDGVETSGTRWDDLHALPRFRPAYPSEHAVRFLAGLGTRRNRQALDVGCGAGRHLKLLIEYGYKAFGVDSSLEAMEHARVAVENAFLMESPMTYLPFADDFFHVALSYGVFYYGTAGEATRAIGELHRVLRPAGRALVVVRTDRDWRAYMMREGRLMLADHPENGLPMHFLDETDIDERYGMFSEVRYELTETTTDDMGRLNSDWLISVTK